MMANWDPYTELGLDMPAMVKSGFNTAEVKKAYRGLARKYHPDKV
jgi:DnaJ-class molecular chaperone